MLANLMMIFFCGFFVFFQKMRGEKFSSIVQMQNIIWMIAFVIYMTGYVKYWPLNTAVYIFSIEYLLGFNITYCLGFRHSKINIFQNEQYNWNNLRQSIADPKKTKACILASFVCWIVSAFSILGKTLPFLINNGLSVGMNLLRYNLYGSSSVLSTFEMMMIDYIFRPVFLVTIILMSMQLSVKKLKISMLLTSVINAVILVLLTAGRTMMVSFVLYIVAAVICVNGINILSALKKYKRYIIPLLVLLVIFVSISTNRLNRNTGVIYEIVLYYFSGLPLFSSIVTNGMANGFSLLGEALLSPIIDVLVLLLNLFGGQFLAGSQQIANITKDVLAVGDGVTMNATASVLLAGYLDFGWIGPLIYGIIYGYLAKRLYIAYKSCGTAMTYAKYLYILVGIVTSIQNYQFLGESHFVIWILFSLLLKEWNKKCMYLKK